MKICRLIASLMTALILTSTCAAVDLTKIDRTIKKEPVYRHQPKYGLAVFGSEAKTRVWMVLDGDVLYVDRNGNGDLTEKGECIRAARSNGEVVQFKGGEPDGAFGFDVGEVVGEIVTVHGKTGKCNMSVVALDNKTWMIACSLSGSSRSKSPWSGNFSWWVGDGGVFHGFASKREEAPIFHFSGPLTFDLEEKDGITLVGGKKTRLVSHIGTPGLGEGTFAAFGIMNAQEALGGDKGPNAEVELPSPDGKGRPVILRTSLSKRMCGCIFYNSVQIPQEVGKGGKAKITLALPHPEKSKIGKVAPATFEVPIGESKEKKSKP